MKLLSVLMVVVCLFMSSAHAEINMIEYSARDCAARPLKLSIHSGGIEHACRRR